MPAREKKWKGGATRQSGLRLFRTERAKIRDNISKTRIRRKEEMDPICHGLAGGANLGSDKVRN